jgi:hypothetical protein
MVFGPPEMPMSGFGNAGGDGGEGGDDGTGESQQGPLIGQGGEDEDDTDGLKDVFEAFKVEGDDDDGDGDDDSNASGDSFDVPPERIQAMQTEIGNLIKGMRLPDDAIPEDFDVNNRVALQGLMNRTVQAAVSQSLNVVFKPVQLAMSQMAAGMQSQIEAKINGSRREMQDSTVLETTVPEINNPKYAPLVKSLDATLKTKGKKVGERAKTIRKMLNQMGINDPGTGSTRRSSGSDNGGATKKVGKSALDSFFGEMPKMNFGNNGGSQNRR